MTEHTVPALSPEQIPMELAPHYVEPGTVYDDEPGEFVPPGWYVLGDHGHGEGADIEIKIEHAVDANGNDITGPLAAKIAELLAAFATTPHDEPAPRVPQPGDRVFGWAGRPFGTVHGFVVADEITNAAGFIAVKAPAVATPYAVDPTTVEVIEPAPCAPKAGVDYCGATHPDYGECFLDVDTEEHAHGHESETGRWPVTDSRPADTGKETDR